MTLKERFKHRDKPVLNIYFTAGFPQLNSLPIILKELEQAGVDMVEIGIPYSDPLSDGPTIQNSNSIAISNGITTDLIFEQLEKCNTKIPKIIMGYFNAVYLYGIEKFCKKCKDNSIIGVILPDLPLDIYQAKYQTIFEKNGISMIFLVTPETSEERIRHIDQCSSSFIYAVSSSSTTGKGNDIRSARDYLIRLKNMNLNNPLLVGFSIKSKEDFDFVSSHVAGGIIGSAFIKQIADSKNLRQDIKQFIQSIRN